MGYQKDLSLLQSMDCDVEVSSGCCGLAGNFGMEKGHYEISAKIAEDGILKKAAANPARAVMADGFSCRTQVADLADLDSRYLVQVIADVLDRESDPSNSAPSQRSLPASAQRSAGSSLGNARWLTPALTLPLTEPAVLSYGLKATLDPSSPLYIPLSGNPQLLRFLIGFARHCHPPGKWREAMDSWLSASLRTTHFLSVRNLRLSLAGLTPVG